jgi:hypothetical protein
MDTEQQRRVAKNEAKFRAMNELLTEAVERFRGPEADDSVEIMCECADTECTAMLTIAPATYAAVREHPRRFLVAPEHVTPQIEIVTEQHEGFWIVEKVGVGATIAEQSA